MVAYNYLWINFPHRSPPSRGIRDLTLVLSSGTNNNAFYSLSAYFVSGTVQSIFTSVSLHNNFSR